jgi:hypothetical protein
MCFRDFQPRDACLPYLMRSLILLLLLLLLKKKKKVEAVAAKVSRDGTATMAFKNGGLHSVVWRRCSGPTSNRIDIAPPPPPLPLPPQGWPTSGGHTHLTNSLKRRSMALLLRCCCGIARLASHRWMQSHKRRFLMQARWRLLLLFERQACSRLGFSHRRMSLRAHCKLIDIIVCGWVLELHSMPLDVTV